MRRLGLLALLLIAAIGAGAGWLDSQISRPYRGHRPEKVLVEIPHGTSRWGVAGILRQNDVVRNRLAFALFSFWHFRVRMQAGEYYFDHPVDTREVFWQLAAGRVYVRTFTIPEGWTMFDIASEVDRDGVCSREDFLAAAHKTGMVKEFAPNVDSLEGFLFPIDLRIYPHHVLRTDRPPHGPEFPRGLGFAQDFAASESALKSHAA